MINYEKIEKLKKYDGFDDLVEAFKQQADTWLKNAITASEDSKRLKYLSAYEVYINIIKFLERKTIDKS